MNEKNLTFLTTVELPEFCFLSEAVEWVALGRVPQASWTEERKTYKPVEYRFHWGEMPDNFQNSFSDPFFDRFEFEAFGIPIPEQYFEAINRCFDEDVWGLPARLADYETKTPSMIEGENGQVYDFWEKMIYDGRALLAELTPFQAIVDGVADRFKIHFDLAWAKIFQLLVQENIKCSGVNLRRWERLADHGAYERAARFDDIPACAFALNHSWRENRLDVNGREFVALRIRTDDVIKHRKFLLPEGKPKTLVQMGAFFSLAGEGVTVPSPKRGRPHHVNWSGLKEFLGEMIQGKNLPATKESCIYEIITHSERHLGKSPSRSSVQRNLRAELNIAYPEN